MWDNMSDYFTKVGAERCVKIMMEADDKEFMRHYKDLLEYFKPKQQRVDQDGNQGVIVNLHFDIEDSGL
jgi:hypothetical protein